MPWSLAQVRSALELAARAPSAHNTQPWRVLALEDRVEISADLDRHLWHGDPNRRDLRLGLGAFTESLRLALRSQGLEAKVDVDGESGRALVTSTGSCAPEPEAASLLRRRETSRLAYSPREPGQDSLTALQAAATAQGLRLHLIPRDTPERADVEKLLFASIREGWLDLRATRELSRWLRFDPEGLRAPEDGLSTLCLGLDTPTAALLQLLMRPSLWRAASTVYAASPLAGALAEDELKPIHASPLFGLLIAEPGRTSLPESGRALLQVWLEATRQHLALHPSSALLDRRGWEMAKRLGVSPDRLLFAFRLGRSVPPPRSGRRAVTQFAKFALQDRSGPPPPQDEARTHFSPNL